MIVHYAFVRIRDTSGYHPKNGGCEKNMGIQIWGYPVYDLYGHAY